MIQLLLITPDGAANLVAAPTSPDGFLPAVRRHLGNGCQTAEPMFLGTRLTAWVDEDGIPRDLEPNPIGTSLLVGLVPALATALLDGGLRGSIVLSGGPNDAESFDGLPDGLAEMLANAAATIAAGFDVTPS